MRRHRGQFYNIGLVPELKPDGLLAAQQRSLGLPVPGYLAAFPGRPDDHLRRHPPWLGGYPAQLARVCLNQATAADKWGQVFLSPVQVKSTGRKSELIRHLPA